MIMIAGYIPRAVIKNVPRRMGKIVPDRTAFAVLKRSSFNLIRRGRRPPQEILRKAHNASTFLFCLSMVCKSQTSAYIN